MYDTLEEGCPTCGAPPNMICAGVNPCPDRIARAQQRRRDAERRPRIARQGAPASSLGPEGPGSETDFEAREKQAAYDDFWRL